MEKGKDLVEGSQVPSCMGIVTNVASMAIERKTAGARTNQGAKVAHLLIFQIGQQQPQEGEVCRQTQQLRKARSQES
jgi:endo-alpha-1,4-polygalactosaminidase (GH114 family)